MSIPTAFIWGVPLGPFHTSNVQSVNCYLLILIDLNRLVILIILKELTALLFTNPFPFSTQHCIGDGAG